MASSLLESTVDTEGSACPKQLALEQLISRMSVPGLTGDILHWLVCEAKVLDRYPPNFIAVDNYQIISASPNQEFVQASVTAQGRTAIIVPVNMPGHEHIWAQLPHQ